MNEKAFFSPAPGERCGLFLQLYKSSSPAPSSEPNLHATQPGIKNIGPQGGKFSHLIQKPQADVYF